MRDFLLCALAALLITVDAKSATLTVNSVADNLTSDNFLTLREAVVLVDNNGVANTAASLNRVLTAGEQAQIIQQTTDRDRVFDVNVNFIGNFSFTLDGVTISGGRETNAVAGGGVFSGSSTAGGVVTVRNCKFINNRASGSGTLGGGAIAHTGGDMVVSNCVFGGTGATDRNTSSSSGGAIYYDAYGTVATLRVTTPRRRTIAT